MPGLIDAHTHPAIVDMDVTGMAEWPPSYVAARASHVLEGMLSRGFTTIRDVGGGDFGLARAVAEGYFAGPRLFYGGKQLTQTGGAGDWRPPGRTAYDDNYFAPAIGVICDGVTEVRRAVREEVRRGAYHIKVYLSGAVDSPADRVDSTQFSLEELRAIVEEATAANIYVAGHAYTSRAINRGLECGVRSIEHGNLMDASSIPLFKRYGAFYVPTLVTYRALADQGRRGLLPDHIDAKLHQVLDQAFAALELAHRAGLPIAFGTDLFGELHEQQLDEFTLRARGAAGRGPDQVGHQRRRRAAGASAGAGHRGARRVCRPARRGWQPVGRHSGADDARVKAEAGDERRQGAQERAVAASGRKRGVRRTRSGLVRNRAVSSASRSTT